MHRNIKLLLAASILIHSGANLLAPLYAVFLRDIGGSLLDTGIAVGIYAILRGLLYLLFSRIPEDRLPRRIMIFSGYIIMGLAYAGYLLVEAPIHVFFLQALLSLGESVVTPSWSATIATSLSEGREREIYSHFYGYRSLFEGCAAILGGYCAMQMGFTAVFTLMAIFAFLSALLSLWLK